MIGKAHIDDILHEGKKEHTRGETISLRQMPKQSKAHFIREYREVLILKDLTSLNDLLFESDVFLIDIAGYLPEFLTKHLVMIHHF